MDFFRPGPVVPKYFGDISFFHILITEKGQIYLKVHFFKNFKISKNSGISINKYEENCTKERITKLGYIAHSHSLLNTES